MTEMDFLVNLSPLVFHRRHPFCLFNVSSATIPTLFRTPFYSKLHANPKWKKTRQMVIIIIIIQRNQITGKTRDGKTSRISAKEQNEEINFVLRCTFPHGIFQFGQFNLLLFLAVWFGNAADLAPTYREGSTIRV